MKVLVTGASGLLGRAVVSEIKSKNWEVVALAFSRCKEGMIKVDIKNAAEVDAVLERERPDFVVHAAAERFPDRVEKQYEETRQLNISASANLAKAAKKVGSRLLYISTDYVFDGTKPPYSADDKPNPLNKYGLTKLEGEVAVKEADSASMVLRIPILYGPVEQLNESAVTSLLSSVKDTTKTSSVSHYEKRYPAHVASIANIICQLLEKAKQDASVGGIYQWSGLEQHTKYSMCEAIAEVFNLPMAHLSPDDKPAPGAPRPYDSKLDNSRLDSLGITSHIPFKTGIKECLQSWV